MDDGPGLRVGPLDVSWSATYPAGIRCYDLTRTTTYGRYHASAAPDSYYYRQGEIVFNTAPSTSAYLGWVCTVSGDFGTETVKATFECFGPLIGGDVTVYARTLLDDGDAATARGTLGCGTIATQDSNAVTITGGSISGVSELPAYFTSAPVAKSGNHTVLASESGTPFTNEGAGDATTMTLPEAVVGLTYRFIRVATQAWWIQPEDSSGSTDKFRAKAVGVHYELGGDGTTMTITCYENGVWDIVGTFGSLV